MRPTATQFITTERLSVSLAVAVIALSFTAFAQTDEIRVYDAEIAPRGMFNLMVHTNFIPLGHKTSEFAGAIISNLSVNGAAEWLTGSLIGLNRGSTCPYTASTPLDVGRRSTDSSCQSLFVRPHAAEHKRFYGVNFEFSVNTNYWERKRTTSEVRPIVGAHLNRFDLIANPILDMNCTGQY